MVIGKMNEIQVLDRYGSFELPDSTGIFSHLLGKKFYFRGFFIKTMCLPYDYNPFLVPRK